MTKEKEIDHWRIGGKPTGIISAGNPSRIDRLTNGCRPFANDSGSRIHVLSDLNSAVSTGELFLASHYLFWILHWPPLRYRCVLRDR